MLKLSRNLNSVTFPIIIIVCNLIKPKHVKLDALIMIDYLKKSALAALKRH